MAKRGRKPKGEYPDKVAVLSTRITAKLRQQLEDASTRSGRSLSQEIESRLSRSFDREEHIKAAFGDRRNYAFCRLISAFVDGLWNPEKPDQFWLSDPYQYNQAVIGIKGLLEHLRPEGTTELTSKSSVLNIAAELQGSQRMGALIVALLRVDPTMDAPIANIRADMSPKVTARIKAPFYGNAKMFRAEADRLEQLERAGAESKSKPKPKSKLRKKR